jgi:hypothetical protein
MAGGDGGGVTASLARTAEVAAQMLTRRKEIVWLASFPKSGNTWARILLPELCTPCDPAGLIRVRAMAKGTSASPPTLG